LVVDVSLYVAEPPMALEPRPLLLLVLRDELSVLFDAVVLFDSLVLFAFRVVVELSVLTELSLPESLVELFDMSRESVAVPPLFAATCAPEAVLVVVVVVVRCELSLFESVVVTERSDMSRLSEAEPPLLAATCAPEAPLASVWVERSLLSVLVV